ncbi:MAG: hypothetical protein VZT48_13020, partial [Bulleidia sp.]|nr:hypothetical protein [Bulleidia sp.]
VITAFSVVSHAPCSVHCALNIVTYARFKSSHVRNQIVHHALLDRNLQAQDARVMHYRDDMGMEADAVYQLSDGRYALIEIKTGAGAIPAAEKGLLKFQKVIRKHNEEAMQNPEHPGVIYREPDQLIIICANAPVAYTTDNGVKVIPFGCLRD